MGPHPDDVTGADDFDLVAAARHGDRLAFGVLYLRHHAAAWRIACVASRFSPDAELAVIEGFTRLFSALPEEAEEFGTGVATLRPYVLACTRQAALDRAETAGRGQGPGADAPAPLAGLGPDGEIVLSTLEHHVAREALAALPERSRTALWLFDVEAMTPAEVAGILGSGRDEAVALAGSARAEVGAAQQAAFARHEVRSGCRFTVEHLDAYRAGELEPTDGLIVRSHLDRCPPCRMRHGEMADAPATLAAAVPAAPLLGGEAQQHWLTAAAGIRPADDLLAPGLAAAGAGPAARRLPDVLRRAGRAAARSWRRPDDAVDLSAPALQASGGAEPGPGPAALPGWTDPPWWSGSFTPPLPPSWTQPPAATAGPPGRRPPRERRKKRPVWPVVTSISVVAVWLAGMMAVPWLMTPGTAAGPDGMALPVVQAYVDGLLPDSPPGAPSGRAAVAKPAADRLSPLAALRLPAADPTVVPAPAGATPVVVRLTAAATASPPRAAATPVMVPLTVAASTAPAIVTPALVSPARVSPAVVGPAIASPDGAPGGDEGPPGRSLRTLPPGEPHGGSHGRAARGAARRRHGGHAQSA